MRLLVAAADNWRLTRAEFLELWGRWGWGLIRGGFACVVGMCSEVSAVQGECAPMAGARVRSSVVSGGVGWRRSNGASSFKRAAQGALELC